MFCTKCGNEFSGNFCSKCGAPSQDNSVKVTSNKTSSGTNKKLFDCYFSVLSQYAVFDGRAGRREFWMFQLANIIFAFGAGFIDGLLGLGFVSTLYTLALILPNIGLSIRRCHDVGKSGWYCLIPIYNIVLFATEGENHSNDYGDPV